MNRENKEPEVQEPEEQEKDLISFEDVNAAISGNEEAIIEQLERAKQVALEQLQQKQQASLEEKTMLQQELAKKEAELKAAKEKAKEKIANTKYKKVENAPAPAVNKTPEEIQGPVVKTIEEAEQSVQSDEEKESNNNPEPVVAPTAEEVEQSIQPVEEEKKEEPAEENKKPEKKVKPQPKQKVVKVPVKKVPKKKEPGNFKYYLVIIFFIALFAFVYFLPEISKYMAERAALKNAKTEIITTGNLDCKKSSSDDKFDYDYKYSFYFQNSKLINLISKVTTSGSLEEDQEELEKIKNECDLLKEETDKLKGVEVKCTLDNYSTTTEQELHYADINADKVTNGYIEAGGTYPNYKYKQNINKIEKEMKASGYKCERTR